jgi:hypothetical protein
LTRPKPLSIMLRCKRALGQSGALGQLDANW